METGTIENNRRIGRSPKWTKRDNNHLSVLVKKNKNYCTDYFAIIQ